MKKYSIIIASLIALALIHTGHCKCAEATMQNTSAPTNGRVILSHQLANFSFFGLKAILEKLGVQGKAPRIAVTVDTVKYGKVTQILCPQEVMDLCAIDELREGSEITYRGYGAVKGRAIGYVQPTTHSRISQCGTNAYKGYFGVETTLNWATAPAPEKDATDTSYIGYDVSNYTLAVDRAFEIANDQQKSAPLLSQFPGLEYAGIDTLTCVKTETLATDTPHSTPSLFPADWPEALAALYDNPSVVITQPHLFTNGTHLKVFRYMFALEEEYDDASVQFAYERLKKRWSPQEVAARRYVAQESVEEECAKMNQLIDAGYPCLMAKAISTLPMKNIHTGELVNPAPADKK